MNVMVLVPAFNEGDTIRNVVEDIKHHLPGAHIVVVNDGSTDKTKETLITIKGITALHHPVNVGIGGAIKTGFHFFLQDDFDYLIRIDGDGQHPPSQAKDLLAPLIQKKADAVIGSRFLERKGYQSSFARRGGIKLLHFLTNFILKQKITDNTSGFKAYNREAIEHIIQDFPIDYPEPIEVYMLAERKMKITEVPVHMKERQGGLSSISLLESYSYLIKVLLTIFIHFFIGGKK